MMAAWPTSPLPAAASSSACIMTFLERFKHELALRKMDGSFRPTEVLFNRLLAECRMRGTPGHKRATDAILRECRALFDEPQPNG
jgi:hypothetical protein